MKCVLYIVGVIAFLLVWVVVAVVIGLGMEELFPSPADRLVISGIGLDWRNLPGTILGLLAGAHSFRACVRGRKKKETNHDLVA